MLSLGVCNKSKLLLEVVQLPQQFATKKTDIRLRTYYNKNFVNHLYIVIIVFK